MRLLIVEDEPDMLFALVKALKKEGYAVDCAEDGEQALDLLGINPYDGVVLDLNLPKLDGTEVLRALREQNADAKVLILSARSGVEDRVHGLDLGANDYLVKPFHISELKARLRALLRRQFVSPGNVLRFGDLALDSGGHSVTWKGEVIPLAQKEFAILHFLMLSNGEYVSGETLIEHVWDENADPFSNAVRVHIHNLRKKLEKFGASHVIQTLPGAGYKFDLKTGEEVAGDEG